MAAHLKLLHLPTKNDILLARLETVEEWLMAYVDENEDREAALALVNLQQTIQWWISAFPEPSIKK